MQQYSNFFPQKGGWNNRNTNQGFQNNTQQDFYRRTTVNGVEAVGTPAKDKKSNEDFDKVSSHSKNSFVRDGNFRTKQKPFKPSFEKTSHTEGKPSEQPMVQPEAPS